MRDVIKTMLVMIIGVVLFIFAVPLVAILAMAWSDYLMRTFLP